MKRNLSEIEADVIGKKAILLNKEQRLAEIKLKKADLSKEINPITDAISLAKKCLEASLDQKKYIEDVISAGLTEVFGIQYSFILETVYGDDNTVKGLKPRLQEENGELDDPLQSFGAGAQAIASVCFRIAILLLSSGTAKVLVLDEPLANVSPTLQDRFKAFVETTCKQTGLQLIMVTHMDQPFGKVYCVSKSSKKNRRVSTVALITPEL